MTSTLAEPDSAPAEFVAPDFNLLDEPWIRVITTDNEPRHLSIRDVFREAGSVRRISGELPTQDFAVLRLLTAILWRSYTRDGTLPGAGIDAAEEWWAETFETGELALENIERYLDEQHDRFWLIHPTQPFYQVADLSTSSGEHSAVERLIADAESDYFSSRAGKRLYNLSYAEAARWLLHAQSYDYSGIKPAAVGDARAKNGKGYPIGVGAAGGGGGVIIHGANLIETLILNLPSPRIAETARAAADGRDEDRPAWELSPHTSQARNEEASIPLGALDALTWQSRRLRLFPRDGLIAGVLITNGDKLELKNNRADPFFGLQHSKNLSSKTDTVFLPRRHYSQRTFWRGVESLLYRHGVLSRDLQEKVPAELPDNVEALSRLSRHDSGALQRRVNVELVGIDYGTQDSVITDIVHTEIPVTLTLLTAEGSRWSEVIVQSVRKTLEAASAVGSFAGMLVQAAGGEYAHNADASREVLAALETEFRNWLFELPAAEPGPEPALEWRRTAREVILDHADALIRDAGPQAYQGRIVVPDAERSADARPRLNSAGTARIWLLTQLNKHLPLQAPNPAPNKESAQ
ncbi:type I-E CRISPR-associated protein Cse1/CasA [Leucobacter weissii]|uniref:Type I-E CRISPR-associated protein Cse1/CasA n=1 Tax=Leucobacter weissii TaxID=1983706 RepID=A0A939S730_9MICO|nr:type I-E CRISPR-associated protein Cse1/CasA [Leucobacter weissii]MBO1900536.1 type I-E CRISPR-associated protein Cse1/CasA [Leucobacter weissii]